MHVPRVVPVGVRLPARHFASGTAPTPALNPRWLTELQARIGALRARFGDGDGGDAAARLDGLSEEVDRRWLEMSAGREGFLSERRWRGLDSVGVAWGDMDSMGHVNNTVYNRYAESARVNWARSFAAHAPPDQRQKWLDLSTRRGVGLILRSIKTEYKMPVMYPDRVTVIHRLAQRPTSTSTAVSLDAVIYSETHRRVAARCAEDVVIYHYPAAKVSVMEPFMVSAMQAVYDSQEEKRREVEREIGEWDGVVRELEGKT